MSRSPYLVNRAFRTFAASTILAVMATSLGVIVNGIIVGNLMGSAELSSVNLVSPLIQLYNALTALVCVGGATLCAVLVGKGDNGSTGKVFAISMIFTAAFAVALAAVGLLAPGSVTGLLCSDESLEPLVEEYARVALIGSFAYLFLPGLGMFVRVDGSPRTATIALATANIVAPVLCVAFVESGMGLTGASLSVVIGYIIGICILLRHFARNRASTMFRPKRGGMALAPKMLVLGAPIALASLMMVAKMLFMNSLTIEWIGTMGVAAMAVAMNVLMLATMVIGGTCQTIQPIGGTLYGSGDVEGISFLTRMVAKVLLTSLAILVLLVVAFPGTFCSVFGITDPALTDYCSRALRLFAPCALMYGVNYALMVLFQVLGHKRLAIVVSVVQPLAVMAFAAVLVRVDTDLLWASFWIGEVAVLAGIAAASFAMRRRDSSLYGFLLGRMPEVPAMAVSVKGDLSDLDGSLDEVCAFLKEQGVPDDKCERARLCCEELAMNISQHAVHGNARRTMDIVARGGNEPSVTIRDDGPMFNPMAFDGEGIGIPIAKRMCASMDYSRAMGQNNVRFTLRRSPSRTPIIHRQQSAPHGTDNRIHRNEDSGGIRMTTRVAVLGACGRMGSLIIRRVLATEGMEISAAFDLVNIGKDVGEAIGAGTLNVPVSDSKDLAKVLKESKTDVLIDFTIAAATAVNAPAAADAGVNLIIGTTGLTSEQKTNITEAVVRNNVAAVISSNYSIGVGVFFKLIKQAADYLGNAYDVEIIEAHHNQKKDAPSGTAVTAAEIISKEMGGKKIIYGREGVCPRGDEICIHAVRGGDIVGDHTVMFIGNSERIEVRHQAHSREIFVGGAVLAAGWVVSQKKGVVYDMSDVLN